MKLKINLLILICLSSLFLSSCSSHVEVNSARDALRLLLQTYNTISEQILYLEEDTENKDLLMIEGSLSESLIVIEATKDYCVDADVNQRYENAMRAYDKCKDLLEDLKE